MRDLSDPDFRTHYPATVSRLRGLLGPVEIVTVTGAVVFDRSVHQCAAFRLDPGLGEVTVTVPADVVAGDSFAVSSPAGSWPRLVLTSGALEHPFDHTRGLPRAAISVLVVANDGGAPVVQLYGSTQP